MAAAGMGPLRRDAGGAAPGYSHLLDEWLLERVRGGSGRGAGAGSVASAEKTSVTWPTPSSWPSVLSFWPTAGHMKVWYSACRLRLRWRSWIFGRSRPPFSVSLGRVVVPIILVLAASGAGMGYYYWRVTGSPFRMTYQVNRETYATAPYFLWESTAARTSIPARGDARFLSLGTGALRGIPHPGRRCLPHMGQAGWIVEVLLRTTVYHPAAGFPVALARQENALPTCSWRVFLLGLAVETWTHAALRSSGDRPHLSSADAVHAASAAVALARATDWRRPGAGHAGDRLCHGAYCG